MKFHRKGLLLFQQGGFSRNFIFLNVGKVSIVVSFHSTVDACFGVVGGGGGVYFNVAGGGGGGITIRVAISAIAFNNAHLALVGRSDLLCFPIVLTEIITL